MSSRLSPPLADFAEGRWPDERGLPARRTLRDLDSQDYFEPPLHPSEVDREPGTFRWVPVGFVRFMIIFFIGVGTTVVWQSYGNAARRIVASLTPGLRWLAPPPAPGAYASGAPADQLAAISHSLAAVRQSVDKLAADVAKLQAAKPESAPAKTSGLPPATTGAVQRKP